MAEKTISKTARASLRVGVEAGSRLATAWVFEHKVGKMQTRPFATFFGKGGKAEAEEFAAQDPERFYVISW